jgi:hypothetical protein
MNSKIIISIGLLLAMMAGIQLFAQSGNSNNQQPGIQTFKVFGNCDMCKARIEKAALSVSGVKSAAWDKGTKLLKVDLKSGSNIEDVQKAVAKAGHDTEKFKAEDKVYNGLPGCCKYRK